MATLSKALLSTTVLSLRSPSPRVLVQARHVLDHYWRPNNAAAYHSRAIKTGVQWLTRRSYLNVWMGMQRYLSVQAVSNTSKKRTKRKAGTRPLLMEELEQEPSLAYPVVAYATSGELALEGLRKGLIAQGLYIPTEWRDGDDSTLQDVIHVHAKYPISDEPREIFFFRDGTVVFWNVPDLERLNVLKFLKSYEVDSYPETDVMQESEFMVYGHNLNEQHPATRLSQGKIQLNVDSDNLLFEKYTVANAMALSVKLGIWESELDKFVDSIDHVTQEMKGSQPLKMTRAEVLQKTGELFALRNELNLNSDLLDTPEFYWEHENLEALYHKMYSYLSISRRTDVMNEKLSQCCELLELISGHLNDKHHVRLEWMIIALITIEVVIGIHHVIERSL